MAPSVKLTSHPDKEEIISQLVNGVPVREVADWLRERYPNAEHEHLRVSFSTIQNFKKQFLNPEMHVNRDLRAAAAEAIKREETVRAVEQTSAYQEKLSKIVDTKLDVQKELHKVFVLLDARLEHFYNMLTSEQLPSTREERVFQGYIDQLIKLMESYKKYVEGYSESVEHNININIMNEQIVIIRDAVKEALADASPDVTIKFMDNLNRKMRGLEYGATPVSGYIMGEVVA